MSSSSYKPSESELTRFLVELGRGGGDRDGGLMDYVYQELRGTAEAYMRRQSAAASLQPTVLVHDAFVALFKNGPVAVNDRTHFFALAAKVMRHALIKHARTRRTRGRSTSVLLEELQGDRAPIDVDLLDLNEAMQKLSAKDERSGRVVELRYFGGLSIEETARVLGVSSSTVERDWTTARAWLGHRLGLGPTSPP